MTLFDSEIEIIKFFQEFPISEVCFAHPEDSELDKIFQSIHDKRNWSKWKNSSAKNDPPT